MNCPQCLADNDLDTNRCWKCGNDLVSRAALSSADLVRVQRVGRLCARWRERAAALELSHSNPDEPLIWEIAQEADTLRKCADDLESEWAGTEPTH